MVELSLMWRQFCLILVLYCLPFGMFLKSIGTSPLQKLFCVSRWSQCACRIMINPSLIESLIMQPCSSPSRNEIKTGNKNENSNSVNRNGNVLVNVLHNFPNLKCNQHKLNRKHNTKNHSLDSHSKDNHSRSHRSHNLNSRSHRSLNFNSSRKDHNHNRRKSLHLHLLLSNHIQHSKLRKKQNNSKKKHNPSLMNKRMKKNEIQLPVHLVHFLTHLQFLVGQYINLCVAMGVRI